MIRVIDDYGIDLTDKCYAVGKIVKSKYTRRDGTVTEVDSIQSPAYFPTFQQCLSWLVQRLRADSLRGIDCDLTTALRVIQEADERLNRTLYGLGYAITKLQED